MKMFKLLFSGMVVLLTSFIAKANTGSQLKCEFCLGGYNTAILSQSADTEKHFTPCVKIHHCLFRKANNVSVNVGGKHYLQVFDSKGQKLNEYVFTGKHYKLDISNMPKGSYSVYVFDYQMKLLDLKPMIVK
jgi:hypothetical protein